jgi:hypothetical protein
MKKRKILLLIPFAGLVLSGCTFQEGWQTTTNWLNNNIWTPVKTFFENLFNGGGNGGGNKPAPGPETPDTEHEGTLSDPLSAEDAIAIGESLEAGKYSDKEYYVQGVVQSASYGGDQYGNYNIVIESGFEGFHMKYGSSRANFSNGDINSGDIVLMYGKIKNYNGKYELDGNLSGGAYVVSVDKSSALESITIKGTPKTDYIVGEKYGHTGLTVEAEYEDHNTQDVTSFVTWSYSKEKAEANDSQVTITASYKGKSDSIQVTVNISSGHAGTQDDPLVAAEANAIASGLASGSYSDQAYYVKGVVQAIEESPGETYKNYTFTIEDGFKGYRMKKANNGDFEPGEIEVGYTVLMYGKIKNFNSTYELDGTKNGGAYVVDVIAEVVEVESVSLSQNEIAMEVDDLVTLQAFVYPNEANQKVNWTVEQEGDIVSFNQETGVITGLAVGTATITATSVENADAHASATVTVSEKTKILTDIEIDTSEVKVNYNVSESYSYAGIVVTAKYSNAEDQEVTAAAAISMDKSVVSDQDEELTITVVYGEIEKQVILAIHVSEKSSLQIAYEAGEALDDRTDSGETKYEFSGVVVGTRGTADYFIQNGSYGIDLYTPGSVSGLAVGKNVTVTAPMKKYNGTIETGSNPTVVVGETASSLPNPVVIDSAATFETLKQNILVNITGVATNHIPATGDQTLTLNVNGDLIPVYVKGSVRTEAGLVALNDVYPGDTVTIENAISGVFKTTQQVLPCAESVATVTVKQVASATITGPSAEVQKGTDISINDLSAKVVYVGESGEVDGYVTSIVSADTSTGGQHTGYAMVHGYSEPVQFTYTVSEETPTYKDATMTKGTSAYDDGTVNGHACIKIGTSSLGGDMTITVPANATELVVYAVAWKGVSGLSLNITSNKTGVTTNPTAIALTADDGATGNSPFTLVGNESNFKFTIALSGVSEETVLKFETSAKKRCIVWGAQYR